MRSAEHMLCAPSQGQLAPYTALKALRKYILGTDSFTEDLLFTRRPTGNISQQRKGKMLCHLHEVAESPSVLAFRVNESTKEFIQKGSAFDTESLIFSFHRYLEEKNLSIKIGIK